MWTKTPIAVFTSAKFTVAFIGRSSVGKSSLFNALHEGENYSVVAKQKNITRDRIEGYSELFKVPVRLVDTAGIENVNIKKLRSTLQEKMLIQTLTALTYSDVALFVVDAKNGITQLDIMLAQWLKQQLNKKIGEEALHQPEPIIQRVLSHTQNDERLQNIKYGTQIKHIILVANKSEHEDTRESAIETLGKLKLGDPVYTSAMDGTGLQDLIKRVEDLIPQKFYEQESELKKQVKLT